MYSSLKINKLMKGYQKTKLAA